MIKFYALLASLRHVSFGPIWSLVIPQYPTSTPVLVLRKFIDGHVRYVRAEVTDVQNCKPGRHDVHFFGPI